jgi:hypothetical protein
MPVAVVAPEAPVTVTVQVPGVVPPLSGLVHPSKPAVREASNRTKPSVSKQQQKFLPGINPRPTTRTDLFTEQ